MHTLTISRNSLYLRWFIWVWDASPEKLNICKLFWGTIFFPLACLNPDKKTDYFLSRSALCYVTVAIFFFATNQWPFAIIWLAIAVVLAISACIAHIALRRLNTHAKQKEKEQVLSRATQRGSVFAERLADYIFGWLFNLNEFAENKINSLNSQRAKHISGFFGVIAEYYHAIKHRYCPLIRVA